MITRNDVEHIARLARIELTEAEEAKFEQDLASILEFVSRLNELDTTDVKPLTGGTELVNAVREDEPGRPDPERARRIVAAAPRTRDGYVEVKAVFQRDSPPATDS